MLFHLEVKKEYEVPTIIFYRNNITI